MTKIIVSKKPLWKRGFLYENNFHLCRYYSPPESFDQACIFYFFCEI